MAHFYRIWIRILLGIAQGAERVFPALPLPTVEEVGKTPWTDCSPDIIGAVLGSNRVCHGGYWDVSGASLTQAESAMLDLICTRAGLRDGQSILEYDCGWGGLSLWMAARYPNASITAVAATHSRKRYIDQMANRLGIENLVCVIKESFKLRPGARFDSILLIESFAQLPVASPSAIDALVSRLKPGGCVFVQATVRCQPDRGWVAMMPGVKYWVNGLRINTQVLTHLTQSKLRPDGDWWIDGHHLVRSILAWIDRLTAYRRSAAGNKIDRDSNIISAVNRWLGVYYLVCSSGGGKLWKIRQIRYINR